MQNNQMTNESKKELIISILLEARKHNISLEEVAQMIINKFL